MSKKSKIFFIVTLSLVILVLISIGYLYYHKKQSDLKDYNNIQKNILEAYNSKKAYGYALSSNRVAVSSGSGETAFGSNTDLTGIFPADNSNTVPRSSNSTNIEIIGRLIPGNNIEGEYKIDGETKYSFVKISDIVMVKPKDKDKWEKNETMFKYVTNILSHPEYIQIQKRMDSLKLEGKNYLRYEILFQKPNQEILKTMTAEQLESILIYGTILIDPDTFVIKQLKLHQGKTSTDEFTISYSALSEAPKIEAPQ